jgi:hypothetical protein
MLLFSVIVFGNDTADWIRLSRSRGVTLEKVCTVGRTDLVSHVQTKIAGVWRRRTVCYLHGYNASQ